MNANMKNSKNNEIEINISVIGLSGSERDKGVKGAGKSCICNRLAQPNHYKNKHSSVVTSIEMNNTQWIFWGCIEKEIRGRRCKFRFIEQTVMVDDISHCAVSKKEDYIKRATELELNGTKSPHTVGPTQCNYLPLSGKTIVHLFLLVYDVSNVDRRDPNIQDTMFKQLFDYAILTKRPVIVISTKHDQVSTLLVNRLNNLLEKKPYNRYPIVETSALLGINLDHIFELAVLLCDNNSKTLKQRIFSFQEAFLTYKVRLEECRHELRKVALSVMDSDMWHATWHELRRLPSLETWIGRLGADVVETTFDDVRMDVRLKRRVVNQKKHKECLLQLLSQSHHLFPSSSKDMKSLVDILKSDAEFMTNFIVFDRDAEYFDFSIHNNMLPLYILDENNENNLIFVVKEYLDRITLENQLFQQLISDCPGNFRKSQKELGEYMKQYIQYFIPDKIVVNVYERFQLHYFHVLECQFLEALHDNTNLLKNFIVNQDHRPKLNGVSKQNVLTEWQHDSNGYDTTRAKEINSKIDFAPLPLLDDEHRVRELWISNYLQFLSSSNECECIYQRVTGCSCNDTVIVSDSVAEISVDPEGDRGIPHIWYMHVIGSGPKRKHLTDLIASMQNSYTLELCKVHRTKYEIRLLDTREQLELIVNESCEKGDKCCGLFILICADDAHLQSTDIQQASLLERKSNYKFAKYMVYDVVEELIKTAYFDDCIPLEDDQNKTVSHISTLISDSKRMIEPSIIWVVTVCGDLIDYDGLFTTLLKVLKLYSIPRRIHGNPVTVSGCFTSKDIDRKYYRVSFTSYHRAMKALIQSPSPPHVDGLLLVCSLDRLSSLHTCLGIKKYLPKESQSQCHCLLLGVVGYNNSVCDDVISKADKHALLTTFITIDNLRKSVTDAETENQLLDFFTNILKGSAITESMDYCSTNTSSLRSRSDTKREGSTRITNQNVCNTCGQCRSYDNITDNVCLSDWTEDSIYDKTPYEQIPGEINSDVFDSCPPEYIFNETQDPCEDCTVVNCSIHKPLDPGHNRVQVYRTRMRSQSGPDLRNSFDSNISSLNKSNSSTTYCSTCGAKMSSTNDVIDPRKSLAHKLSEGKESPSKKLTSLFQDMFSSSKRLNESQNQESRKFFNRVSSKRKSIQ